LLHTSETLRQATLQTLAAQNNSAVCDRLYKTFHFNFIPLVGPGEEYFVEEVIAGTKHLEAFLYPYTPISFGRGLKILVEHCRFYLGNDNGIQHMAIACGKPRATIFGPINPLNWTPRQYGIRRYLWGRENIASVTPSEVMDMISEFLPLATS
jgi:ADP-heptose:LPS heptosyltransferase